MRLPDGTDRPWTREDLPLDDRYLYTEADANAMADYIREEEDKRILAEILGQ